MIKATLVLDDGKEIPVRFKEKHLKRARVMITPTLWNRVKLFLGRNRHAVKAH